MCFLPVYLSVIFVDVVPADEDWPSWTLLIMDNIEVSGHTWISVTVILLYVLCSIECRQYLYTQMDCWSVDGCDGTTPSIRLAALYVLSRDWSRIVLLMVNVGM